MEWDKKASFIQDEGCTAIEYIFYRSKLEQRKKMTKMLIERMEEYREAVYDIRPVLEISNHYGTSRIMLYRNHEDAFIVVWEDLVTFDIYGASQWSKTDMEYKLLDLAGYNSYYEDAYERGEIDKDEDIGDYEAYLDNQKLFKDTSIETWRPEKIDIDKLIGDPQYVRFDDPAHEVFQRVLDTFSITRNRVFLKKLFDIKNPTQH